MVYVFHLTDGPRSPELRPLHQDAHKAYLAARADAIAFAGPVFADDGTTPAGSVLAIDFPSLADARAWLAGEPFTVAGVYASATVQAFENRWPQKTGFPAPR